MNVQLSPKENRLLIIMGIIFFVTVLGPGFGAQYAEAYLMEQEALRNSLTKEIGDYDKRLSEIDGERETIRANQQEYLKWVERGVVGSQDPVGWVKTMQRIQKSRKLFPLAYRLGEEIVHPPSLSPFTAIENSSVGIRMWNMNLSMAMLHDLDVLMFLEQLRSEANAIFFPIECKFQSIHSEFSLVSRENITAECVLTWVSVEDPDRKDQGSATAAVVEKNESGEVVVNLGKNSAAVGAQG